MPPKKIPEPLNSIPRFLARLIYRYDCIMEDEVAPSKTVLLNFYSKQANKLIGA
jgi:hypothetical protein